MTQTFNCPRGHQWEIHSGDISAESDPNAICPVCRSADQLPPPPHSTDPAVEKMFALPGDAAGFPAIPGYEILGLVGHGGMGVVYKARQVDLKRLVALKMILAGPHAAPVALDRFRAEAEAVARLQHPNIVQIYEVGDFDGRPYLALEYLEGGTLAKRLAEALLEARPAAQLLETLARAVHYAHERGVVHRDLNPANILLFSREPPASAVAALAGGSRLNEWVPKITDFGLAKRLAEGPDATLPAAQTQSGAILGTPSYMAPEQAEGRAKEVGPAADVYALGAILYEALTGRPPFRAATVLDTLEQVRTQEPVSLRRLRPDLPLDLQTICLKCLQKEPAKRYASAQDLADDLDRFVAGEPIRARPVSRPERLWKWARRRPTIAFLAGLCILGAVALLAGGLTYNALLREAVRQAQTNEAEARHQKQQVIARYRQAREALNRMLGRLDDVSVVGLPQLMELQKAERETALDFFQGIIEELDQPDPEFRADLANALEQTAILQAYLGQSELSQAHYRRAADLLAELVAEQTDNIEHLAHLGSCYHGLGLMVGGQKGLHFFERALECRAQVAQARPEEARYQDDLAMAHHGLATHYQTADPPKAESHYKEALAIREPLADRHLGSRFGMADSYINLGQIYFASQRRDQAFAVYEKAENLLDDLLRQRPGHSRIIHSLTVLLTYKAIMLRVTGSAESAVAADTRAIQLLELVLRNEPLLARARKSLGDAYAERGSAYIQLQRFAEATKDWDRVAEVGEGRLRAHGRLMRAICLVFLEESPNAVATRGAPYEDSNRRWLWREAPVYAADAADAADAVDPAELDSADDLYHLASVYARCLQANPVPVADWHAAAHARRTEDWAAKALGLLTRAHDAGYFAKPGNEADLKEDSDLEGLRSRPDFQALVRELSK
jgi:serine/threonine protein kinase